MSGKNLLLLLLHVLLPCALSNTCQEFFSYGTGTTDNKIADDRLNVSVNFDSTLRSGCGALNRLNISIGGRLSLSVLDQDNPIVTFKVFDVDPLDVESHDVYYRDVTNDQAIISCMEDLYEENFPRLHRTSSFTPTDILVATWFIRTDIVNSTDTALNKFQLLVGSGGNRSLVLYLYDIMEWNGANNNYAAVSLETCKNTWTNRDSQTSIIHTTMRYDSTIPGRQGEWVFFIDETGRVSEGVICRTGCSLVTGSCTIEDTCDCVAGYGGPNCDTPICSSGCVNGNCTSPENCICTDPALWSGAACNVPACPTACTQYNNGHCTVPNTCVCNEGWSDPSKNCLTALCTAAQCVTANGVCALPKTCFCYPGWTGSSCNTPVCNPACVNGQCISPDKCQCNNNWTGTDCNTSIVSTTAISTSTTTSSTTTSSTSSTTTTTSTTTSSSSSTSSSTTTSSSTSIQSTPSPTVIITTGEPEPVSGAVIGAVAGGIAVFIIVALVVVGVVIFACVQC